jgi:hypothetical protein
VLPLSTSPIDAWSEMELASSCPKGGSVIAGSWLGKKGKLLLLANGNCT